MKSKRVEAARCSARDYDVRASRLRRFARHVWASTPLLQMVPTASGWTASLPSCACPLPGRNARTRGWAAACGRAQGL